MRSWPAATAAADTVLMAVGPPVLVGLVRTRHGPNRTGRGGRTAASSSTSYGTTSKHGLAVATGMRAWNSGAAARRRARRPLGHRAPIGSAHARFPRPSLWPRPNRRDRNR